MKHQNMKHLAEEELVAFVDAELPDAAVPRIFDHLYECKRCSERAFRIVGALGDFPEELWEKRKGAFERRLREMIRKKKGEHK